MSPLNPQHLRQVGVVGKFVEFFGPGVAQLSIADRATIANMCPEYGATAAFFPVDTVSIQYLEQTGEGPLTSASYYCRVFRTILKLCLSFGQGRDPEKLVYITKYLKAVGMFRDYTDTCQDPEFTQVWFQTRSNQNRHGLEL